jgi:hypothetical protein
MMARKKGHDVNSLSRDDLLRPSLASEAMAKAPYSVRTTFLTAFLGGPLAAIAIIAVNSVRLQRWPRDALPLGLVLAALVAFVLALHWTAWGANLLTYLNTVAETRALVYLYRGIGLALFGFGYLLHRKEQRGADLMGLVRPNGWIAGLACIIAGLALSFALAALLSVET